MSIIKTTDSKNYIPISNFFTCVLDGKTKEIITELYPSRKDGAYYLDKFNNYLKDNYQISIKEYCIKQLGVEWPRCPISNEEVGFRITGEGVILSKFKKGKINKEHCPKFAEGCKKLSEDRRGKNNPMFGKEAWNKGLTAESNLSMKAVAEARVGIKASEETKKKQRKARAVSPLKARHTTPHTEESIEKMRLGTAKRWASGAFNRVSSIHLKTREFLQTLNLKCDFTEEYQVWYFSLDFAFPKMKVAIECQGTYFHVDPRIYPNGPRDAIQRRNFGRDKAKRKIIADREGWIIIEVWETEINDGTFKEYLKCKLSELNLLKD